MVGMPEIIRLDDGRYRMFYGASSSSGTSIKSAISSDGATFTEESTVLLGASSDNDPEKTISGPSIVKLPDGRYRMYYQSSPQQQQGENPKFHVRSAISSDGLSFTRESGARININYYDATSNTRLAGHGTYFITSDNTYVGIMSGEFESDAMGPSDLKIAYSLDGLTWENMATLYTDWHDPIVVKVSDGYLMYTTYLLEKQGMAFSSDGKTWPSSPTQVTFENQAGEAMTEGNSGVGDIGGVVLANGNIRLFTNFGSPSSKIIYFDNV